MIYEVLGPVAGFEAGQTASEEQLSGCNIAALVAGGFLRVQSSVSRETKPAVNPSPVDAKPASATEPEAEGGQ